MSKAIDYQSPTHEINDVLFDVKLQPVYSSFRFPDTLFKQPIDTPNYRAIVNQQNGEIISIVSRNYRLITNSEALEMGKRLFFQIYPDVDTDKLIPYKVVAPASRASANIDLIHEDVNFTMWEQESWLPFLRISNSYNSTQALSFEIGFVRELCSNGVLFNKESMKLKYIHSNSKALDLQVDAPRIKVVSEMFEEQCTQLRNFELHPELIFALVCKIMKVNLVLPDKRQRKKKLNSLNNLINIVGGLTTKYNQEIGMNAYTALNVVTDLVSHQNEYKNLTGYYFNVRSFYARPTEWIEDFTKQIKGVNFELKEYLGDTINSLDEMRTSIGFNWD